MMHTHIKSKGIVLTKRSLQYVSDLHVDLNNHFPKIQPISKYLAICGDVGVPTNSICGDFLKYCSANFEKTYFVPGNHDFDCGPVFEPDKVEKYEDLYKNLCEKLKNVYYCNKRLLVHHDDVLIAGFTLWSHLIFDHTKIYTHTNHIDRIKKSISEHHDHVRWLQKMLDKNKDKQIIILSHFVPTFKLIEDKYKYFDTSYYATDLEYLIKPNIRAWLCGHTHSVISCLYNGTYLGVNAYGYKNNHITEEHNLPPQLVYY